jgi:mitochondrial chaperone BCS1
LSLITDNPYFSAGFGLIGVGAGLAALRRGATHLTSFIRRKFICSLEITSRDPLFNQVLSILSKRDNADGFLCNSPHFMAGWNTKQASFSLQPGQGSHFVRYNGKIFKVERNRERAPLEVSNPFETLTLSWIDSYPKSSARRRANELLEEAKQLSQERDRGKFLVYSNFANEWRLFGNSQRKRSLESVILPEGKKELLLNDLLKFLANSKWYYERGIPYRRGYLLYGPPGGGKSSLIQALASHLDYGVCLLNLAGDTVISDDRLQHLLHSIPEKSFILLEDIDAVMANPLEPRSLNSPHRLSLSGLLNAIDGVAAAEERIIFMTTNYHKRLDAALIRPGRIDFSLELPFATNEQATAMFLRFYPHSRDLFALFEKAIIESSHSYSPAEIQGIFIKYQNEPMNAISEVANRNEFCNSKDARQSLTVH